MRPSSKALAVGPVGSAMSAALVLLFAALLLLLCLVASVPTAVEARVAAPGVTMTYSDGFTGDIFGPDTIYASRTFCCVRSAMASYFPRLTTGGVPRLTLTTPVARMFTLGGPNGYTIIGEDGIYLWSGPDIVPFTLTATDGYSTIVKHVNISFAPKAQFYMGGNFVLDSTPTVGARMASTISCGGGATFTAQYSTSLWTVSSNYFATTPAALPLNQHWGRTDVVAVVSFPDDIVKRFPLFIIQEVEPVIALTFTIPLVDILPVGTAVGKLTWYSDAGVKTFKSLDATPYFSVASSGDLLIAAPLVVGANQQWRVQLISNSGLTVSETLTFSVLAGKLWPSSSISFTPLPLDNHKRAQRVGQASISAFTPTSWSLYNRNNLASFTLFDIDPTTGFVTTGKDAGNSNYPGKLPGRTHQITITATDGINLAKATFDVPVTKIVGPTWHVGRNQSKLHPPGKPDKDGIYPDGSGFETLAEAAHNCMNGGADLKPAAVGFTILIYHDEDPDYYANDNGLRLKDYSLSRGWLGPGTIRAADLNGPRPRVGGYVGKVNSGNDMGSKGFFNIGDGDITIQGLEISWCNGGGDPFGGMVGGTLYGGISCIRKNGHTSGDIILEGNYVHSANNCFEGGAGPFDVYIRNNVMGNAGTEYVSSGATHANYVGGNPYVEATGNLIYNTIAGHNFKTRAYSGLIKGNRIYDGERGGASAQIDIPTGGVYVIEDNDIMKGPNQQSYAAILFNAEGSQEGRPQSLIVRNNRISVLVPPGNHQGDPAGVALTRVNFHQYAPGPFLMENNQWYMSPAGVGRHILKAPYGDGGYPQPDYVETGSVFLDEPFPLNFKDPGTANPPAPRLGDTPLNYDGNGDGDIPNMINGMMVDCGADDLRVYAGAPNGTVVGRCRAAGSAYFQNSRLHKDYEFPFPTGAAWRILPQAEALGYYGNKIPVAPANRYVIHPDTGVITTGTTVNMTSKYSRFDFIIVEAKPKSGPLVGQPVWMRQYIVTTVDKKTAVTPGEPSNNDSSDPPGASANGGGPSAGVSAVSTAPHDGYSFTLLVGAVMAATVLLLRT